MTQVTDYYRIKTPVPFLDVDVDIDKRLFVDPHAVRLQTGPKPFAANAKRCLTSFFQEVARCVLSTSVTDQSKGEDILCHFSEPKVTRLGMAQGNFEGHGGADEVGQWIWDALSKNLYALLTVGILTQVEDLPLFVDGVAEDLTSDITTRIIFGPLARFTEEMVATYPEFTAGGHSTKTIESQVWNPGTREWNSDTFDLPLAGKEGSPLVLVPRDWARPHLLMSATRMYETATLSFVQAERTTITPEGKSVKPSKDTLKQLREFARGRETIITTTTRAYQAEVNLVQQFIEFVDARYEAVDDETLRRKLRSAP